MFSMLRTTLARLPAILPKCVLINPSTAMFHALSKPNVFKTSSVTGNILESRLLTPITPTVVPSCGFKVKGRLKRRCKDCYFVFRQQRLYVICKTHPRHKQMSMVPKEKNTWILTAATQGKVRPW